ncbi:MAG TPA: 3-phosphoshikimate 1-carboxyvinyltransferase, partial [Trueperaceae bacterium]|nr:3-phosphoshikimate 1-carboxyvinyltransferase [Trueperaceae bacterium]
ALMAEDSHVLIQAMQALGVSVQVSDDTVRVIGAGGPLVASEGDLDLRLSGTSIRFLTAVLALGHGRFRLDGNERMRERPIEPLLASLRQLGADATSEARNGCPPVVLSAAGLKGGLASVGGEVSSQFLSALLLAAPYASAPVTLEVEGELQSKPFIDMTLDLMADFGVSVEREGYRRFTLSPGRYRALDYRIEGDAMAAGYFWAAAAVTGGSVRICNLGSRTRQGDAGFAAVLARMGCTVEWGADMMRLDGPRHGRLSGGEFDLNDMPDQAQTLAVVGLFADSPVHITNVSNLRVKETDRLSAMARELSRLGATVREGDDYLTVWPLTRPPAHTVELETYGDHRMAMALTVAGARLPNVVIKDPACVAKTYPGFFGDFIDLLEGRLS